MLAGWPQPSPLLLTLDGLPDPREFSDDSGLMLFPQFCPESQLGVPGVHREGGMCDYLEGEGCFHLVPGRFPESGRKHFDLGTIC